MEFFHSHFLFFVFPTDTDYVNTAMVQGDFVTTAIQSFREGYVQLFRLYSDGSELCDTESNLHYVEITYALGVIDEGREVCAFCYQS